MNLRKLTWPLEVKGHREAIAEFRAFAQLIQFALSIDGCTLLAKTSVQVLDILKNQLDNFKLLQKANDRINSIEQTLHESNQILNGCPANAERIQLLVWVSTLDHKSKHHDIGRERISRTGQWFLNDAVFRNWRDSPRSSVLCCCGIQGSGKSILM